MLRTKRFIKEVNAMRLVAKVYDEYILIDDLKGRYLAYIYTEVMYKFNILYDSFQELSESDRKRLFNLLVEYASTPLDKREEEEEKKFYLKHKWLVGHCTYLNFYIPNNSYKLNDKSSMKNFKTQFTQAEIDEIKERFNTNLEDFEQIPVEDKE